MFKNVIVGLDGGPHGRDASALAGHLADAAGKLTLAHVFPGDPDAGGRSAPSRAEADRRESAALLERESAEIGLEANLVAVGAHGVAAGLHRLAEAEHADLIVVGSCHRGAFGRLMLGDDTRSVLNGAPCAVAIAPDGFAQHPLPFSVIGVAYNGSPESQAALALAHDVAARTRATIRVLEVVSVPTCALSGPIAVPVGLSMRERLAEADKRHASLSGVEASAVCGIPGEELKAFGDELDLLITGSRGYGPVRRLIQGSTSNYLMRHSHCPLLVLPRSARTRMGEPIRSDGLEQRQPGPPQPLAAGS